MEFPEPTIDVEAAARDIILGTGGTVLISFSAVAASLFNEPSARNRWRP